MFRIFQIVFLISLSFRCNSPQIATYEEHSDHSEFIGSCLDFLAGRNDLVSLSDPAALEELQHSAEEHSSNTVIIGDLFYDLNAKEGRHFRLDSASRISYYQPKSVVLGGWETIQHLCARHIRYELEKSFLAYREEGTKNRAEKNLILYMKFAEAVKGKPNHIRNFLFIPAFRFAGNEGAYFPSCNLLEKMRDPILSGLQSAKRNPEAMTAWTQMMLAVTNYSAVRNQDCKVTVHSELKFAEKETANFKNEVEQVSKAKSASKIRFGQATGKGK
ncbi:hypothetical protein EHQ27_17180 [Leptospira wolffii]|uniref:Uncharacterized protein n=1 Tax=Leptospira wolffii TaxID=409998 RepID=A0A2M9Z8X6_9LEPT|nr:hypothetical protein [Leptospira wolffii]PJZ64844.1 hypothetical protein CH371_15130 [Leptospira wolffii]TGK58244.1 hypothetical protein EHQ32_13205 [Leptospira wolffii]TGK66380.1 hypothetical protein EHQ27_17180 [Leptospira wolffii]TGK68922.1 hypothetical protein EHQ35_19075 [Leptospira wolffii]TGL27274.1 hypothetical protein EHQ57_17055 [Leptospira wolffii]